MPTSTGPAAPNWSETNGVYGFTKQQSMPALRPPAYRPPPPGPSGNQAAGAGGRNSSPAEPPPYREPPPPGPGQGSAAENNRFRGRESSPTRGSSSSGQYPVRPPHYSPPPTHRTPHLGRHPSRGSLVGAPRNYQQHGLPYRQQQMPPYPSYQVIFSFWQIFKEISTTTYDSEQKNPFWSINAILRKFNAHLKYYFGRDLRPKSPFGSLTMHNLKKSFSHFLEITFPYIIIFQRVTN